MAAFSIPNLKASKGQREFKKLDPGHYDGRYTEVRVKGNEDEAEIAYTFILDILEGPPQNDGTPSIGKKHYEFVRIKTQKHPQYDVAWDDPNSGKSQMGVDQLKSMMTAVGVTSKGDKFNHEAFVGLETHFELFLTPNKKVPGEFFTNSRNWSSVKK